VQAKESATADMVKELLSILDNFERASGAIKTETDREKSINDSYQSVGKEMLKVLNKLGVEPIEPLGQDFDPNLHNAIQQVESTEYAEGVICQAMQRGYQIGGRVVRPAIVVVSAGPGPADGGAAPAAEGADSAA
jgi:molecular chaperone GrpE